MAHDHANHDSAHQPSAHRCAEEHGHHHHGRSGSRARLQWTLVLAASYMVAEFIGGWLTNSLALLADAGHMLSDVAALALSWFALWIAERPPTSKRTYGFYRAEILAALVNGATLVAVALFIFVEAWHRIWHPPEVQGGLMMGIATGGLVVNLICLAILHGGMRQSLNEHGAWLHVLSDALGSLGAILAGGLVWWFGWELADPIISVVIGLLIIQSSWWLLKESVSVLMESAPAGIDVDEVRSALLEVPGVASVHDLHVWSITSGMNSLSAHVVVRELSEQTNVLTTLQNLLNDRFGIDHTTIQIEPEGFPEKHLHP